MARMTMEETYYVDHIGYKVEYNPDERIMSSVLEGQIYHHFNGFMLLTVI